MNHKSITPNPQQPVDRVPTGQLPSALAALSEGALSTGVLPGTSLGLQLGSGSNGLCSMYMCSYDGDDE